MAQTHLFYLLFALYIRYGYCSPSIGNSISNVTIYAGEDASFTCIFKYPRKRITHTDIAWKRNGEWIVSNEELLDKTKYELSTNQSLMEKDILAIHKTLTIKNVEKKDAGEITCMVLHQQHVLASGWLKVLRKILPVPKCNHHPRKLGLGDVMRTTCTTESGEPPVHIKMYQVKPSGVKRIVKEGFQSLDQLNLDFNLTITRKNIADLIVCEVSIPKLRGTESCTVDLINEIIFGQKDEQEVRVVSLNAQPTFSGETACFFCNVYDHGDVNVVWSVDGRADVTSNISRQYQYCFKDIQLSDNGKFVTCNISSKTKSLSSSVRIDVIERKKIPEKSPAPKKDELMPTPDQSKMADNLNDDDKQKDNSMNLANVKVMLAISLMVIFVLAIAIVQLLLRIRRSRGGWQDNFSRLSTISDRDIDQRYQDGLRDTDGNGSHVLLRQRKLSDDTESESVEDKETEIGTLT